MLSPDPVGEATGEARSLPQRSFRSCSKTEWGTRNFSAVNGPGHTGLDGFCAAYLDDIVVFSISYVWCRLRQAGLTAKPRKCQFGMAECVYLGHVVGGGVVRPLPSKVKAVASFPVRKTKK